MRQTVLALLMVLAFAPASARGAAPPPSPSRSAPREHPALQLLARWARAVEARDFEDLDRVFAADAVVFVSGRATLGWPEFRDRHLRPELGQLENVRYTIADVGGKGGDEVAWLVFRFRLTATLNGRPVEGRGLGTAVLERGPDGWLIIHLHTSSPLRSDPVTTWAPVACLDQGGVPPGTTVKAPGSGPLLAPPSLDTLRGPSSLAGPTARETGTDMEESHYYPR